MQILQNLHTLVVSYLSSAAVTFDRLDADPAAEVHSIGGPHVDFVPKAVVLWHGLGDNYNSFGMARAKDMIHQILPDVFVHSVFIDEDPGTDEKRSLFGDSNVEVDIVCEQLSRIPELNEGFGAIGFSQGGLFMRALVERCPNISVSTLVTFGSPHLGVSELPLCAHDDDWLCQKRNALLKRQVWFDTVQKSVVPAQYFRDPLQYDKYLEHLVFLADVNNERKEKFDEDAKLRLQKLQKLVLVQFARDTTLVPKESAHFGEQDPLTGRMLEMKETKLYREDLVGLKALHKQNKIDFHTIDEDHMRILDAVFVDIVSQYFGNGL